MTIDFITKPACGQEDGMDCYAAPTQRKPAPKPVKLSADEYTKRIVAAGAIRNGSKAEMVADALLNGGTDAVVMLPEFSAVYVGWDDGKTAERCTKSDERTPARTKRIVEQVRFAPDQATLDKALTAAYYYDEALMHNLDRVYGMKFCKAKEPTIS